MIPMKHNQASRLHAKGAPNHLCDPLLGFRRESYLLHLCVNFRRSQLICSQSVLDNVTKFVDKLLGGSAVKSVEIWWRTKVGSTMYEARYVAVDALPNREMLSAIFIYSIVHSPFLILAAEELKRHCCNYRSQGRENQAATNCTYDSNYVCR